MENHHAKAYKIFITVIILGIIVCVLFFRGPQTFAPSSEENKIETNITSEIIGNKDDLVHFSILPDSKLSGVVSYVGSIKGGYFFEGNILIGIADINKNIILQNYANATSEWMTADPVTFSGTIDLSNLPKGSAFIEIHNDNASGLPEHDKKILIPIIIE
jgi:hypothetical protein